jgi:hypothetical protein
MIKIYFAPNWGLTSKQMVNDYIQQTPKNLGIWNNIQYTTNPDEADYLIIQDECEPYLLDKFEISKRLYFSREALTPNSIDNYRDKVVNCSFWDKNSILWTKWWYPNKSSGGINKTYDELLNESPLDKIKHLTCIQSNKIQTQGHKLRYNFLQKFIKEYNLDLYGAISFHNKALDDYKYCLAFDNQNTIEPFFGTQFTDSLLRWCVPLYWGGGALEDYFPSDAFIKIDIEDPNIVNIIKEKLNKDDYQKRLPAIKEARKLILNKYNMWPLIEYTIKQLSK